MFSKIYPDFHHLQWGMKFATHISTLFNYKILVPAISQRHVLFSFIFGAQLMNGFLLGVGLVSQVR